MIRKAGHNLKLKTLVVYVADQEKALAFYRDQIGFDVRRDLPMGPLGRWIEVAPPGAESSIVLYPKAMMPDWDKRVPSIVFACDDTVASCAELVKRGTRRSSPTRPTRRRASRHPERFARDAR